MGWWLADLLFYTSRRRRRRDDFNGATVFLASAASDYVNGEILVVDGGWMGR